MVIDPPTDSVARDCKVAPLADSSYNKERQGGVSERHFFFAIEST